MKIKSLLPILSLLFLITSSVSAQNYYMSKLVEGDYQNVIERTKEVLKEQGFGVMTEIQMDEKLSEKLGKIDMKPYLILGVCNPNFAFKTVQAEENIGLFLPCKVAIKKVTDSQSEVVFINPSVVMKTIGNDELNDIADQVTSRFMVALEKL